MAVRKTKTSTPSPAPQKAETRTKTSSRSANLRPGPLQPETKTAKAASPQRRKTKKWAPKKVVVTPVWVAPSEDAKLRYGVLLFLMTILSIALISGELQLSKDKVRFGHKVFQWTGSK